MGRNEYRKSQLVYPFGVGAMVDFKDETLMSAGLDYWAHEKRTGEIKKAIFDNTNIVDPRLQLKLSNMFLFGRKNKISFFLQPTEKPNNKTYSRMFDYQASMPFVRFPRWYFCPQCNLMKKTNLEDFYPPRCHGVMRPINFLICCEDGHISDFPWFDWVHRGKETSCNDDKLYLETTSIPGIAGINIRCKNCSKSRTLGNIYPKPYKSLHKILPRGCCPGHKPWLGSNEPPDECTKQVEFVQRASSSVYFPNTISSILIPPYSKTIRRMIDNPVAWKQILRGILDNPVEEDDDYEVIHDQTELDDNRIITTCKIVFGSAIKNISENLLIETVKNKFLEDNTNQTSEESETTFRYKEYKAFSDPRPHIDDRIDFDIIKQDLNTYDQKLCFFISELTLVTKLRETRVLTGFSRIVPLNVGEEKVPLRKNNRKITWLPANEVRGEGIFLKFDQDKLDQWYSKNQIFIENQLVKYNEWIKKTVNENGINYARLLDIKSNQKLDPYFILIHTFSHLIIKVLVHEAGYDSSSIRERIYISKDEKTKMYGLLIYTASGDSEGTLGGLVERGKPGNFDETLTMLFESEVCSNDPICVETEKQGLKDLNGAACHSCCLLPETSCEHNNTLLDRRFLFGSPEDPSTGFFSHLI